MDKVCCLIDTLVADQENLLYHQRSPHYTIQHLQAVANMQRFTKRVWANWCLMFQVSRNQEDI